MMMMMMILKAFGVFSYIRERLFFRASDEISSEKSLEKSVFFCFRLSRKLFCPSVVSEEAVTKLQKIF